METTFIEQIWAGVKLFFQNVNWLYVVVFIVIAWLLNEGTESVSGFKWLNWLQKISKAWRTFLGGLILAIFFAYVYDLNAKVDFASLIYSLLVSMVIWKLGINAFFNWFKSKVWLGK